MNDYHHQVSCPVAEIDLDFWKKPEGVLVPDDELSFLLVPDAVESLAVAQLSQQVHRYQAEHAEQGTAITRALMATMGGMLPGILFYDHLVQGRPAGTPRIDMGTIGVSLYKGPNERYDNPLVQQEISIPIEGEKVLIIDDLGDRGGTFKFLADYVAGQGASEVLLLALYMKPQALDVCPVDFHFGEAEQDCWIITPRECVETLVKRVPVWKERGADLAECRRRLVEIIGYPAQVADYYLPGLFN